MNLLLNSLLAQDVFTETNDFKFGNKLNLILNKKYPIHNDTIRGLYLKGRIYDKYINGVSFSFIFGNSSQNGVVFSFYQVIDTIKGVNISINSTEGNIYGLNLSLKCKADINGLSISLINRSLSYTKGVQIGLFNLNGGRCKCCCPGTLQGVQLGLINKTENNFGLQIGLINYTIRGRGIQFGLINIRKKNPWYSRVLPIINFKMDDEKEFVKRSSFL